MSYIAYRILTGEIVGFGDINPIVENNIINFTDTEHLVFEYSEANTKIIETNELPEDFSLGYYKFVDDKFIETDSYKEAKSQEEERKKEAKAQEVREHRDQLIAKTDWTTLSDVVLSDELREKYKIYRQALRDITKQEGFPFEVEFPVL